MNTLTPSRRAWAREIKNRRTSLGLTQQGLAELIGCDQSTVSKWENGSREPSGATLKLVVKRLGIDPVTLRELLISEAA